MPDLAHDFSDWQRLTFARVGLLRELADGRTLAEASLSLGISLGRVRSSVRDLKAITGCSSTRDLGRWWRVMHEEWLAQCERVAGAPAAV
jgi:hypothetical protein